MARKTLPVTWLVEAANARMIAAPSAGAREAIFWFADAVLNEADQYRGFWYAHVAPDGTLHTCRAPEETAAQKADPDYRHYNNPAYRAWVEHVDNAHLKLFYSDGRQYHASGEDWFQPAPKVLPIRMLNRWEDEFNATYHHRSHFACTWSRPIFVAPVGAGDPVEAYRG
jgi:hypothetical protein